MHNANLPKANMTAGATTVQKPLDHNADAPAGHSYAHPCSPIETLAVVTTETGKQVLLNQSLAFADEVIWHLTSPKYCRSFEPISFER